MKFKSNSRQTKHLSTDDSLSRRKGDKTADTNIYGRQDISAKGVSADTISEINAKRKELENDVKEFSKNPTMFKFSLAVLESELRGFNLGVSMARKKCSFENCDNEVVLIISNNINKKGGIGFCQQCFDDYTEHLKAREDLQRNIVRDNARKEFLELINKSMNSKLHWEHDKALEELRQQIGDKNE